MTPQDTDTRNSPITQTVPKVDPNNLTFMQQLYISLKRGGNIDQLEEILTDVDTGKLSAIIMHNAHVVWRWEAPDTIEVVSIFGDMQLVKEFYPVARLMGATKWKWDGRNGWTRVLQMLNSLEQGVA
ncbi:hypothetical protein [Primorskyibacter sp. S87]|uniref:hypothetical protein n=1 Tax=Primorskyibacter sp. S87 TaxID=3415126 RepID=UPI003C7D5413